MPHVGILTSKITKLVEHPHLFTTLCVNKEFQQEVLLPQGKWAGQKGCGSHRSPSACGGNKPTAAPAGCSFWQNLQQKYATDWIVPLQCLMRTWHKPFCAIHGQCMPSNSKFCCAWKMGSLHTVYTLPTWVLDNPFICYHMWISMTSLRMSGTSSLMEKWSFICGWKKALQLPSYNKRTPSSHVTLLIHSKLKVVIVGHRHINKWRHFYVPHKIV